jgi:hypothetical protein
MIGKYTKKDLEHRNDRVRKGSPLSGGGKKTPCGQAGGTGWGFLLGRNTGGY